MDIHHSQIDNSVNFVDWQPDGGAFESRYVRREGADYMIAYVSSHTGCNKSCRMCHLTQTGQTMMKEAAVIHYLSQVEPIFEHHKALGQSANRVNFNFMARGEPLANRVVREHWGLLAGSLTNMARSYNFETSNLNLSTIMPGEMLGHDLHKLFRHPDTNFYYSLYSMKPEFRRRWLPKALHPDVALNKLADWQQATGKQVALHWAFIKDENDDLETLDEIILAVRSRDLRVKFNAVRYNPYSDKQGMEPDDAIVERNFNILQEAFGGSSSRIVPRVGRDVAASCGCFLEAPCGD